MDITATGAQFNIGPLRHIQKQRLMVMIRFLNFVFVLLSAAVSVSAAVDGGQDVVAALLERIGGEGASRRILTSVDPRISCSGRETFVISSSQGKPLIKGSSALAAATGINWYLNHYANINISWNNLTVDLSGYDLPLPEEEEVRSCSADYRYYLNYCTFSYSISTWSWERWEKEIDWMALHGINMPLQIVGLEEVWRRVLLDYGYGGKEISSFIAGPCFQAWWGMNNLQGWGGPNPEWWYERQEKLCRLINGRMRELGMTPVFPGYSGMVPSDFESRTGIRALPQGGWCCFERPFLLDPASPEFCGVADTYYRHLEDVMGRSEYYSMDPFHEGADTRGIDVPRAYRCIFDAMDKATDSARWVIQQWQWSGQQYTVLDNVPLGRLVVLDLYSDGNPRLDTYKGHDVVYTVIPNFGGRTGMMGRFGIMMEGWFGHKSTLPSLKGIGAAPEAIGQTPVLYDALYELPWHAARPDASGWMSRYSVSRYGCYNGKAAEAWDLLRRSVLDCRTPLQGPHEAVMCARPSWAVDRVSTWGGTDIFYDPRMVADAAYCLLDAGLKGDNYEYDLVDVTRQALTDYGYSLLKAIDKARCADDSAGFACRKAEFLELIDDIDALLGTNVNFMAGKWIGMARSIPAEVGVYDKEAADWLEFDNFRTLITTWGARENADVGGLRDYSYRQWNGLLRDYYKPRWELFFRSPDFGYDWYAIEHSWATVHRYVYTAEPTGNAYDMAKRLLEKYIPRCNPVEVSTGR